MLNMKHFHFVTLFTDSFTFLYYVCFLTSILLISFCFIFLQLSEYELTVASDIVDPLTLPISWKNIGGLRETIDEVKVYPRIPF